MSCNDLIKEAAKIIHQVERPISYPRQVDTSNRNYRPSALQVHDEVKDKMFELELSWVTESTGGKYERVPKEVFEEAEKFARAALEDDSDSDDDMS